MTVRINKQKINLREKLAGFEDKVNFDEVVRGLGVYPSDGNVGIGTTDPKSELNVTANNSGQGAILTLENSDTSITNGDIIGQIDFYANDSSENGTGAKLNIKGIAESVAGTLTALTFGTSDSTSNTAIERMRIDSTGNVGIGTTDPAQKLHVDGNLFITHQLIGGLGARSTTTDTTLTDWNHASSTRAGMGQYLLLGTDTNGPEVGLGLGDRYFHILNFEYGIKDGTGTITQWAIGYKDNVFYMRNRYFGTWSAWTQII